MCGSGVVRRGRLGVLIAIAAMVLSITAAVPTAADAAPRRPTVASQAATGSISGTVTNTAGQPVAGVTVDALGFPFPSGTAIESTTTAADGTYILGGVPAGAGLVRFTPPSGSPYVVQWWDHTTFPHASFVTVASGQTTPGIDAQLHLAATITGIVTGPNGQPLAGVHVDASGDEGLAVPEVTTASDGTYTITGLTAQSPWDVTFNLTGYVTQTVGPLTLVDGQTTTANAQLVATVPNSGTLTGVVESGSTSGLTPVAGATVILHNYFGFTVTQTTTAADGTWSLGNLARGVYRVEFQPPAGSGLLGQWWNNESDGAHSDGVGVADGATTANIDAILIGGATVSGTVTDAAGPVAGATVGVFTTKNASSAPATEVAHTTTAADGTYSVPGLAGGDYDVLFDPPAGSSDAGQWYINSPTAGGASYVSLATGGTGTANAQLTTGQRGSISGTVTDASGSPIAGSTVLAVAADGRTTTTGTTAADGTYTINNLDVGIDTVWFLPPAGSNYGASVWSLAVGKVLPVTVDQGAAITGINATLS